MAIKLEHVNYIRRGYGIVGGGLKDEPSIEDGQRSSGLSAIPVRGSPLWYSI